MPDKPESSHTPGVIFRSRYQICDDCECVTIVQRNDARGVPDEVDWDQFPGCMVCGGSMLHWDADEKAQDDIYWAKGVRAGERRSAEGQADFTLTHTWPGEVLAVLGDCWAICGCGERIEIPVENDKVDARAAYRAHLIAAGREASK